MSESGAGIVLNVSNSLQRCFSCVRPPVNLQMILTLERFSTRLTDEISHPCEEIRLHLEVYGDSDMTGVTLRAYLNG